MFALSETTYALTMTGRWDEAVAIFDELPEEQLRANTNLSSVLCGVLEIFLHRGQIERSREAALVVRLCPELKTTRVTPST